MYLPLGSTPPADHPTIPQLRSQPLTRRRSASQERSSSPHTKLTPVALAPLVEGYRLDNASTASSSDPSHTGGTVQSISTHSGGSTATDRTESSSSFIHVSHPVEEVAPVTTRAPPAPQTSDSASGSTVTPQTRPVHQSEHTHPEPAPLPPAPFLSASYLDGDSAETGITSLDPAVWWIGAHGMTGAEQRTELARGIQTIEGLSRASSSKGSIAETRVSGRSTYQRTLLTQIGAADRLFKYS
jgi:hypothetical protein